MLFNSYSFIFIFLPLTLLAYWFLGRVASVTWALSALSLASLIFYGCWDPFNLLLIGPSIVLNYFVASALVRLVQQKNKLTLPLLIAGVAGNVAFLSYFKYRMFLMAVSNDVFHTDFVVTQLILPLGISFITFQKIAFLIDIYTSRVTSFTFHRYALFVLFFPQLIAGPIVHYGEMMPQFEKVTGRLEADDFAIGVSLFAMGLFKKAILADGIAEYSSPLYAAAASGDKMTFFYAWFAAFGFTLQLYFDFSGYSDMALGLARFFGIRLPVNFNSPLRASSISDFWARWHMTLTRFLTSSLFSPMVLVITLRRDAAGKPIVDGRRTTVGALFAIVVFPTMITMLISGVWHGAGYQFLIWGLMQGAYLSINSGWRLYRPLLWRDNESYHRVMRWLGFVLTMLCVLFANVMFRADTPGSAVSLWGGMVGLHGISLPKAIADALGPWLPTGIAAVWTSGKGFVMTSLWIIGLLAIAFLAPNSLRLLDRQEPALGFAPLRAARKGAAARPDFADLLPWRWQATPTWAWGTALISAIGLLSLGRPTEFLYWQF